MNLVKTMPKMLNKVCKIVFLLFLISIETFSQKVERKSWQYISLGLHAQNLFKSNDRISIIPLNYEYLPAFFNHHYAIGAAFNFNNVKPNYQQEFSVGIRNTFYLFNKPKFRPYFGFGIHTGNIKRLNEWSWSRSESLGWQIRIFTGIRIKIAKNYLVFAEYGNYRIGSPKFNLGFGITRTLNSFTLKSQ